MDSENMAKVENMADFGGPDSRRVTRNDVLEHMNRRGVSGRGRLFLARLLDKLGVDGFMSASEGQLATAYHEVRPDAKTSVGGKGLSLVDEARKFIRDQRWQRKNSPPEPGCAGKAGEVENQNVPLWTEVNKKAGEADRPGKARPIQSTQSTPPCRHVFTRRELKALSDVMEVCGLDTVDLGMAARFFEIFGIEDKGDRENREDAK